MSDTPERQHYNVTFALLAVAATTFALLQSLVAPALLTIQHDFATSAGALAVGFVVALAVPRPSRVAATVNPELV